MSVHWQALHEGDVVDIVAPAWATEPDILTQSIRHIESWGLKPRVPKNLFKKGSLFSHDDEIRWAHLKTALLANDSKAIWCLRGGYGSLRLLPDLAKMEMPKKTKLLIGISDVTSLHTYLNLYWRWPTLHGVLLDRFGQKRVPAKIEKETREILFGKKSEIQFKGLRPLNTMAKNVGSREGVLIGGNLTTLQSAIGTPYDFNLMGKFLFLEEIGERGYRIDRMLVHFEQAGKLKGCRGIFLGHLTGGDEPKGGNLIMASIRNWARSSAVPVFSGISSGHGLDLRPLPLGCKAYLENLQLHVKTGVRI